MVDQAFQHASSSSAAPASASRSDPARHEPAAGPTLSSISAASGSQLKSVFRRCHVLSPAASPSRSRHSSRNLPQMWRRGRSARRRLVGIGCASKHAACSCATRHAFCPASTLAGAQRRQGGGTHPNSALMSAASWLPRMRCTACGCSIFSASSRQMVSRLCAPRSTKSPRNWRGGVGVGVGVGGREGRWWAAEPRAAAARRLSFPAPGLHSASRALTSSAACALPGHAAV